MAGSGSIYGGAFQPGTAAVPSTQVEINVSCRHLKDRDSFSKSDPMCVMMIKDANTNSYHEFGRTEMIKDNLNPDFAKKFVVNYFFEESQKLKFELYDVDSPNSALNSHVDDSLELNICNLQPCLTSPLDWSDRADFLGRIECTLGEIVGAPKNVFERLLQSSGNKTAKIFLRAEEVSSCKETVGLQFKATKLDKKDFFGKSDPFLVFYRANEDGSYTVVHRTEIIKNTLNPTWKPFAISARALCNGDHDRSIKVECYDWDSDGGHDLIGEFVTNLREFTRGPGRQNEYEVIHPQKKSKKRNYKNSGEIQLLQCNIEVQHSFLDYIQTGTQMNFTVAVDFTASNGNPSQPTSLHYLSPYQPNQYSSAIQAVGEIIQDYDSDKMFPSLGFGAKLPDGSISHEFALNFNPTNPYCQGIQGVLQAYYTSLKQVQLYGPTNFSPVINHVARFAQASQDGKNYFVLLIITDGVISDMPQTVEAIVNASYLPMSIIIVGVGNAEFDAMDQLDSDNGLLRSHQKMAARDIVQFVPFREFIGKAGNNAQIYQAYLAKEVLAEIPDQVTAFMKKRGIKPQAVPSGPPPPIGSQPMTQPQQFPPTGPPPPSGPPPNVGPTPSAPPPKVPPARPPPPSQPPQNQEYPIPAPRGQQQEYSIQQQQQYPVPQPRSGS